jgi:4-aminobutyrate aminotransferase/(S)-3-amino-2-methylpropionate transaminase
MVSERLTAIAEKHPCVGDVRGRGAMMAVELVGEDGRTPDPARTGAVSAYCHSQGVVTLTAGTYGNVLRFLPPLVTTDALLTEGFDVVAAAFDATA